MTRVLLAGLGLTAVVTGLLLAGFGRTALLPGLAFGGLATAIELLALGAMRRGMAGNTAEFFKGAGYGMVLRLLGVVAFLAAVLVDRVHFPPLPSALGYVGVVVPLLFLEVRFIR